MAILFGARAFAQPTSVTYVASEGCPSEAEFAAAVAGLLKTRPTELPSPISVSVALSADGAVAGITYADARGVTATRELSAKTCEEVTAAAALVTALAIDAIVQERGAARTQPEPVSAPPAPTPAAAPVPAPREPTLDEPGTTVAYNQREQPHELTWQLGAGVFAEGTIAPQPMLGGDAFVGVGQRGEWDVRTHVGIASASVAENEGRAADFQLIAGRVDACALRFVDAPRFALEPCVVMAVGSLRSEGAETATYRSRSQRELWAAAGPMLRAQATFAELVLDAQAGPWVPVLGTRTYVFERRDGAVAFHEVPPIGWFAAAQLGFRL